MSNEVTLAQLAAEVAQLRQQFEGLNQRLDMIYGAVTRLAETTPGVQPAPAPAPAPRQAETPSSANPLAAEMMMMDPGSMLTSLYQYASEAGLTLSFETVERLKSELPTGE